MKPSIGRVIWFHPAISEGQERSPQPWPAFVTFVHSDNMVNVAGFTSNGAHFAQTSVRLLSPDEDSLECEAYAEWMPYQIAQAKKQDEETAQLADKTDLPETEPAI